MLVEYEVAHGERCHNGSPQVEVQFIYHYFPQFILHVGAGHHQIVDGRYTVAHHSLRPVRFGSSYSEDTRHGIDYFKGIVDGSFKGFVFKAFEYCVCDFSVIWK